MKGIKYITFALFAGFISLLACPGTSSAQSASVEEITRQAREAGIEQSLLDELQKRAQKKSTKEETIIIITRSATELAKNNLPYEMIFNKSFEGLTKGVSNVVMETAILNIRQDTEKAAAIVDPWLQKQNELPSKPAAAYSFRKELIIAISNAMRNDVSASAAEEILTALSEASLPVETGSKEILGAVRILPDMTEFTGSPEAANRFVVRILKSGFTSSEMLKLPTAMRYFQSRNQLPATAMLEKISEQMRKFPASKVIQNLITNEMAQKNFPGRNKIQSRSY